MKFGIQERLVLLNVLPQQGDAVTLRILRDFQTEVSFTEEEKKAVNLVSSNGQITWNAPDYKPKDIEVGDTMKEIVVGVLKGLNAGKKLTQHSLPLYDRFVSASAKE